MYPITARGRLALHAAPPACSKRDRRAARRARRAPPAIRTADHCAGASGGAAGRFRPTTRFPTAPRRSRDRAPPHGAETPRRRGSAPDHRRLVSAAVGRCIPQLAAELQPGALRPVAVVMAHPDFQRRRQPSPPEALLVAAFQGSPQAPGIQLQSLDRTPHQRRASRDQAVRRQQPAAPPQRTGQQAECARIRRIAMVVDQLTRFGFFREGQRDYRPASSHGKQ